MPKPANLTYGVDESPPLMKLLLLGLQYACMMFPYLIIVVILQEIDGKVYSGPISLTLIALSISTILQSFKRGPIGSGYLAPPVVSAIYFPASLVAVKMGGLSLVYGMTIFAGVIEAFLSFFLHLFRKYFPPLVSGLIIIAVGLQLGLLALSQTIIVQNETGGYYSSHLITACITFATMIILTVWAKGIWRLLSPFFGIVIGFIISIFFNLVTLKCLDQIFASPWFAFPDNHGLTYSFSFDLMIPFTLAAVASALRAIGVITTCQKINDTSWMHPQMNNIKKGVLADGCGCFIAGMLGVPGINLAPSLVGISQASGATSRVIGVVLSFWLVLFAFMPKFIFLFLAIPLPVMGAALLFTSCFMISGGIELIGARKLDTRSIVVIGVSLLLGISQAVFPGFYAKLPSSLHMVTSSMLSLVTISALLFNVILRIKVKEKVALNQHIENDKDLPDVVKGLCKKWNLQENLEEKIVSSIRFLVLLIERGCLKEGAVNISMVHDPVEVILNFTYIGTLPQLNFEIEKEKQLVEETAFTLGLSSFLTKISADRVRTSAKNLECLIELYFHT